MKNQMPAVQDRDALVDGLNETQRDIVEAVFKGKTNQIRATKPCDHGPAAYVWRHVVFLVSSKRAHQCMPIMADFDLKPEHFAHRTETYQPNLETDNDRETVAGWDEKTWAMMNRGARRRAYIENELKPLVDLIVNGIDKSEWHGVHRWGRAFGVL